MVLTLCLLGAGSEVVFAQVADRPDCKVGKGPVYLDGRDPGRTSVVVFVHGVLSDAVGAWSRDPAHSWPCLLRADPMFDASNIYLYGYPTEALGQSPSIEEVSKRLLDDLIASDVFKHAHVTIVAHSMGGLVVSRMLLSMQGNPKYLQQLKLIRLVEFYGTPATGADIANIASQLSNNVQFAEMRRQEQQQRLVDQWAAVSWPFQWYCLAEGKKTGWAWLVGTQVVSRESAAALCQQRPPEAVEVLYGFDHITMVKPVTLQDEPYRALFRKFQSCVAGRIVRAPASSEAATPQGKLLLAMVSDLRGHLSDASEAGRLAMQPSVQEALYKSSALSDRYFMPKDLNSPGLTNEEQDRLNGSSFANEFVKAFQPVAERLVPQWVARLGKVSENVPEGQLTELLRQWVAGGLLDDTDYVIGLNPPSVTGQVLVVAAIQTDAAGVARGRVRGLLVVPQGPPTCQ